MNNREMSKRQMRREQVRKKEQRSRLIAILLISLGALFLAFLIIYPSMKPVGDITAPVSHNRPNADFNTAGDPNAPITVTEFSDFQCPYCRIFFENTEELLMEKYVANGTVYFVYKTVGEFIGPESKAAAEAAYCAGDQGKFWEMHDIIFANQTGENVGAYETRRLNAFADELGLDRGEYDDCFNSGKYSDLADQDAKDATAAGIQATPSFLITYEVNGETQTRLVQGAQTIDVFSQEIDAALAEMGQ
ncbi:MAG: DsbA family protein [Anaerolineales bacterium]|nr:DsbA family protein [Anaerolineales bacterium]MCB9112536.1 DsbA family protein [Anaerolineales bacterium]